MLLIVFALFLCGVCQCLAYDHAVEIQGRTRVQKKVYEHIEYNALANEFQLINPGKIKTTGATPGSVGAGEVYWVKPTGNLAISNDDEVVIEFYSSSRE